MGLTIAVQNRVSAVLMDQSQLNYRNVRGEEMAERLVDAVNVAEADVYR